MAVAGAAAQAFKVLETLPVGAYLVRVSAQRPACFVVSYVADNDKVRSPPTRLRRRWRRRRANDDDDDGGGGGGGR